MSREEFMHLVSILRADITKNEEMAIRSSGAPITAETRLAIALHILAGGKPIDAVTNYLVSESSVYTIFHEVINAVNKSARSGGRLRWSGSRELSNLSN